MNTNLINNLREVLLKNTSKKTGQQLFDNLVQSIADVTQSVICSLWSINKNNASAVAFQSSSIIAQSLKLENCQLQDCIFDLENTFIKKTIQKPESYYEETQTDTQQQEYLDKLGLNYFIGIPIPDFEDNTKVVAVLKLSYTDYPEIENKELFAEIIRDYISSSLYRHILLKKERIAQDLIENYQAKGSKKIGDIFYPIVNTILRKYCDYEGASLFIWDSYMNHFELISTTGIVGVNSKNNYRNIFYQAGEGLSGTVVVQKKTIIYDNLCCEERHNSDYKHKYIENTHHSAKTMMVVPIFRPSNPDEVIGILRFVNKKNHIIPNVLDYFNDTDVEIMSYASHYIALTIDYFLAEEERNNFISKLSHEFSTPANTIRITADRLRKKKNDKAFMDRHFDSYIESIFYLSELQIQQTTTNLYVSKAHIPRSKKYTLSKHSLKEIIFRGKTTVIPIAREMGVRFDNIVIDPNIPIWNLYVDDFAFITVFYNLLTNAIKYRSNNIFHVNISGRETPDSLIIDVSDYGIGIEEKDMDKIFLTGFRGENASKRSTHGFGIGLSVVKQIINDFGGFIKVANFKTPTKFEISLPKYLLNDNYTKTEEWNK